MAKLRISLVLAEKASSAFRKWGGTLPTGAEGLTRAELRALERAGIIRHRQKKLPSGSIVNVWTWVA